MNSNTFRRFSMVLVLLLALAAAAVVLADNVISDGDGVEPVSNRNLTLGTICLGSTNTRTIPIAILRRGAVGTPVVFQDGSTVRISVQSVTGSGLSVQMLTDSITLPPDWGSLPSTTNDNTLSSFVTAQVTLVPGTLGAYSELVQFLGTGVNASGNTLLRPDIMRVTANVISCNTAPVVSVQGVSDGASYEAGAVPTAVCQVMDAEDGSTSFAAVLSAVTGPQAAYGLGQQTASCAYTDGGGLSASSEVSYSITDTTAPVITYVGRTSANAGGWNNTDVIVNWSCSDSGSGVVSSTTSATVSTEGLDQAATGSCSDNAGNTVSDTQMGINIDKTAPGITWNGSINNGDSFHFGLVPAVPTCAAADTLSGPNGCAVSGYGTTVGSHTLTATAYDNAGNSNVETRSYTVLAWSLNGFFQPVDMNGVYNTVKNGSTVPLKFEILAGSTEFTNVSAVQSLASAQISCSSSTVFDEIEVVSSGNTVLRYDATSGQFIYNWKTPNAAGNCYRVTMTTQDGSALVAYFKLK